MSTKLENQFGKQLEEQINKLASTLICPQCHSRNVVYRKNPNGLRCQDCEHRWSKPRPAIRVTNVRFYPAKKQ